MIIKLTVDRVESGISVLFDENGDRYSIPQVLTEGDLLECRIGDDGSIDILRYLFEEASERKCENKKRLKALFCRGGNK